MRVLITGAAGQDGTILASHLANSGAELVGLAKPGTDHTRLLRYVPSMPVIETDLADTARLGDVITEVQPTHVWNFGGLSDAASSWDNPEEVWTVNFESLEVMLGALRRVNPGARLFQAASAHIFEGADRSPQSESFELSPKSPYARSKSSALELVRRYRSEHGMFAVSGILYNHESPLRGENFVTRKVSKAVARISAGLQERLELGDIEVARDWGWAPDYVRATLLMLSADEPKDYVLATGISHRLSFFIQKAFAAVGITDWQNYVVARKSDRPVDTNKMVGDSRSAYLELGWRHTVDFDSIAQRMVEHDLELLRDPDALWWDPWMGDPIN